MEPKLDKAAIEAIEGALRRGLDVWIYRNKTGVVISSQTRKTLYSTPRQTVEDGAIRAMKPK